MRAATTRPFDVRHKSRTVLDGRHRAPTRAPHPTKGEVVVAFVVTIPSEELTTEDLIAFCKRSLAGFKVPWAIQIVDALPRTTTGKMMRRDLREPAATMVQSLSGVRG
jgi:acyl-coenzyme A synthetase/AMP-(fatty) acid ligase